MKESAESCLLCSKIEWEKKKPTTSWIYLAALETGFAFLHNSFSLAAHFPRPCITDRLSLFHQQSDSFMTQWPTLTAIDNKQQQKNLEMQAGHKSTLGLCAKPRLDVISSSSAAVLEMSLFKGSQSLLANPKDTLPSLPPSLPSSLPSFPEDSPADSLPFILLDIWGRKMRRRKGKNKSNCYGSLYGWRDIV